MTAQHPQIVQRQLALVIQEVVYAMVRAATHAAVTINSVQIDQGIVPNIVSLWSMF